MHGSLLPGEVIHWIRGSDGVQQPFQVSLQEAGELFFVTLQQLVLQHGADLKSILDELKQTLNVSGKRLFMPVRIALTGQLHGPELLQIVGLLGKEKMQQRFNRALELVKMVARDSHA